MKSSMKNRGQFMSGDSGVFKGKLIPMVCTAWTVNCGALKRVRLNIIKMKMRFPIFFYFAILSNY